mmetsp:Transcript_77702/g.166589  ORF Transcript_77702/g.166589 Transcript_77702/m.166589 type:complete len:1110 (+) Transcript_77702:800-4129(+)
MWHLRQWEAMGASVSAMIGACRAAMEIIAARRDAGSKLPSKVAPSERYASKVAVTERSASKGSKSTPAVGAASGAVRQQRNTYQGPSGGGHATSKKGFVEAVEHIAASFDHFNSLFEEKESSEEELLKKERKKSKKKPKAPTGINADIARMAKELRTMRKQLQVAPTVAEAEALRRRAQELNARLRELWRRRQQQRHGKLVLEGTVYSKGRHVTGASVELAVTGVGSGHLGAASTDNEGGFHFKTTTVLGRTLSLTVKKEGFADGSKRTGGDGEKHVRIELLPLSVRGRLQAEPGHAELAQFEDVASGARFAVPVGDLLKGGEPFHGEVDFSAAVVDVASKDGVAAMPPLTGRTLSGALVPMQSLGAVFVDLKDAWDGEDLVLRPGSHGIDVELPSSAPLPRKAPSLWHYDKREGEWEQLQAALMVNGSELPAIDPDEEARETLKHSAAVPEEVTLRRDLAKASHAIQNARAALDSYREDQGDPKICTCGYQGKLEVMPLVRANYGLPLADPPKRVFAETEANPHGGRQLAFPYLTIQEKEGSARRASEHAEVILSHHLVAAKQILELGDQEEQNDKEQDGKKPPPRHGSTRWWRKSARSALPHLRVIAAWLLDGAKAANAETGEPVYDVDPTIFQLKVLERLANLWATPSGCTASPITLHELREALAARNGDVAVAFFDVAEAQSKRNEVAQVRQGLKCQDDMATAKYRDVERALKACAYDVAAAVEMLMKDSGVRSQADKLRVRTDLHDIMPMAHPTSRQVEEAMAVAEEAAAEAEAEAISLQEQAEAAVQTAKECTERRRAAEKILKVTEAGGSPWEKDAARKALEEAKIEETATKEAVEVAKAAAEQAVVEAREAADPLRIVALAAKQLSEEPAVKERAEEVYRTWTDTLVEANETNNLEFQIKDTGWNNIDAPEEPPSPPPEPECRAAAPEVLEEDDEFYPPVPVPICPVRVSSMVLGAFDDGVFAKTATAVGLEHRGVDYSEEVQPDGTFSLLAMASSPFELRTQKSDGTDSFNFGPFHANYGNKVTHLGLLEPPRPDAPEIGWNDLILPSVEVALPRLEFPPHGGEDEGAYAEGGEMEECEMEAEPCRWGERCTCFDGEIES